MTGHVNLEIKLLQHVPFKVLERCRIAGPEVPSDLDFSPPHQQRKVATSAVENGEVLTRPQSTCWTIEQRVRWSCFPTGDSEPAEGSEVLAEDPHGSLLSSDFSCLTSFLSNAMGVQKGMNASQDLSMTTRW
ncbi:hypothetical protein GN956_G15124 [Arapaima gigas]